VVVLVTYLVLLCQIVSRNRACMGSAFSVILTFAKNVIKDVSSHEHIEQGISEGTIDST
jgi:hypothetical protein